jgi:hypothetical protein
MSKQPGNSLPYSDRLLVGEYSPVEDVFQILDHLVFSYLRRERLGRLEH